MLVKDFSIERKKRDWKLMLVVLIVHTIKPGEKCEALLKQKQHIETFLNRMFGEVRDEYRTPLGTSN